MTNKSNEQGLTLAKGLIALFYTTVGVALFVGAAWMLGIAPLYAGFLFLLYFGSIKQGVPRELPAALIGALGGVSLAALLHILPAQFGTAGIVAIAVLLFAAVYASLVGWVPLLINTSFMIYLTVVAIPAVQAQADFLGIAGAILLAAAFAGALILINKRGEAGKAVRQDLNPTT